MQYNNIELELVADNGRPMKEFVHEGKTFVESREGSQYALRIKNHSGKRVLVIASVDSLNVIDGKPSKGTPKEAGYILDAYDSYLIKGFRVDDETVAAFGFVKKGKSYATSVGAAAGNGVIAVRAYGEKEKPRIVKETIYVDRPYIVERPYPVYPHRYPIWYDTISAPDITWRGSSSVTSSSVNASNSVSNGSGAQYAYCCSNNLTKCTKEDETPFSMGTEYGKATQDKVTHASFEAGDLMSELVVYYAPRAGLEKLGVKMVKEKKVVFPEPFSNQYSKPPKGWSRD